MSQVCANCKFWDKTNSYPAENIKLGKCKKVKMFWDSTRWVFKNGDYVRELNEEFIDDKAFVQDGSDYLAFFITKENFGCNQFIK